MALFTIPNIAIAGIASCAPKNKESNRDYDWITHEERELLIKTTGIVNRRVAAGGITTSDMCFKSAKRLIDGLQWKPEDIQVLIFVSQSPDYFLPATSVLLQNRLGLPKTTIAFDISLGCSGYVYGLSTISSLMAHAGIKKGLLLAGDISTQSVNKKDKSTYPLFGDAGTATALIYDENSKGFHFNLQSDGAGGNAIIIPDGGLRNPLTKASFKDEEMSKGIWRNKRNLELKGVEVFSFSITEVPPHLKALIDFAKVSSENLDFVVFHQANKLIIDTIQKILKLDDHQIPMSLHNYGNTSSASIPLTITSQIATRLENEDLQLAFCGYGVGLSWASVILNTSTIYCPALIEI
ncbi:MAG: ketoacyl-ACP synthase III [Nonlabens sp.]